MDENSLIKFVIVGAAAYLGYNWLQSSGLWAEWFGGNAFTTAATLIAYCQANPSGTASFNGQSAPCSSWLAAAAASTGSATPGATAAPTAANPTPAPAAVTPTQQVTPLTVQQLLNAVEATGAAANTGTTFDADQWNYYVTTAIDPAAVVDMPYATLGYTPGAQLTAAEYISLRQSAGVSGIRRAMGYLSPYRWKM